MNCTELKAEIIRAGKTNRDIATGLEISEQALYNKLNGRTEFKNSEIKKISAMLNLSIIQVNNIFFENLVN